MDSKNKGMAWISKIRRKTETFFAEVDGFISQEPLKYVENELLTVGENVKQFCSELIQDVLDLVEEEDAPSSLKVNKKSGDLASKMVNIGLAEQTPRVSSNLESPVHDLSVEPEELVEELNSDSPFKKQYDSGTNIEENAEAEALFSSQIQEAVSEATENGNDKSLFCGVKQANIEGSDNQGNLSSVISFEFEEDSMIESKKINDAADTKDDVLTLQPTLHSNVSGETNEHKVMNDPKNSLQSELDPSKISEELPTLSALQISAEASMITHSTEPGMPTTSSISKLNLGDSCIIVDSNEICSASEYEAKHLHHQKSLRKALSSVLKFGKEKKHKKVNLSEDLNNEIYVPEVRNLTPPLATGSFESTNQDFNESEWEII